MDIHPKRLYGPELIAKVKMSAKLRKAALVLRCGYAKVLPRTGHILPDYDAFYTSLIEARREQEQILSPAQQCNNDLQAFTDYERRLRDAYAKSKNQGPQHRSDPHSDR